MASMPGHERGDHPDDERADADVDARLAGDELADLEERGAGGDRGRHQEAENARRPPRDPGRRSAPAEIEIPDRLMPGHERQRLGGADADRDRERDVLDALGPAAPAVGQPQDRPRRRRA